jgi:catechol 2,3-dioxygenase-like lactoylglutathione lyase family enzyme
MPMAEPSGTHRITHVGLCVADLDRALRFYRDAIGMEEVGRMSVPDGVTATLLQLPASEMELVYLQRDGLRLELIWYRAPSPVGDGRPREMNRLGLTHLSVRVDRLEDLVDRISAAGGQVLDATTVHFDGGNRGVMALDPDGTRVELIERA